MPWYTDPALVCKFFEKIARRYERSALDDLKSVLDNAIASVLKKQEHYRECRQQL
jgi:hypothetical protein